ncbi:MAG: PD-(D/E)XK nuclease family protein [Elusimicrobia bacterium]|nr:PD-(D/E)XK nuclease family protein [Elusimicrobiota bacterium]
MSQLSFDGFEINAAPAAPIAPTVEPASWYKGRVLSHSSISTYRSCPQKWKFRYIDKVPEKPRSFFSFGKSVHAGLEFLFSREKSVPPTLEELLERYRTGWLREGYESAAQEKWFFQEGERILRGFFAKHKQEHARVLDVELKFTVVIEGVTVMGYIDRIDEGPKGGLAIVDYKTGKAFDKARVKSDPQLTLYQIACAEIFGRPVESVTLYHLNSLTALTVPAHPASLEAELKSSVLEAARGINDGRFDARPDERGVCQYCDYAQICPALAAKKREAPGRTADPLAPLADRFGKLDARISELEAERDALSAELKTRLSAGGVGEACGEHFTVEMKSADDGEGTYLIVRPNGSGADGGAA